MSTANWERKLTDMVHELTETTTHNELYTRKRKTRHHTTTNPPLLEQLARSAIPSYTHTDNTGHVAGSRPSANVDAIDTHTRIHTDAARWHRTLGTTDHGETTDLVRRLTPHALTNPDLAHDIHRWWTWARVATGWDLPPFRPDNTCPICGTRGTLRIRIVERLATCVNDTCRETWDDTTLGLLADHIRTENGEHQVAS